ncbi:uncharacterized protein LOC141719413 [Apium graveolens]|uniref:uncharacterized protein LOC141719413 n=1 Tax=Apium graveolens TaxID=4045 RepID=UPI003D7A77FC
MGIEANTDKIKTILDMELPHSIKDNQKLTRRIAALGRLISKSGDKSPLLAKPSPEDTHYLYFTASEQAVSPVLVKEEHKLHKPVYYVSKVLHGAEFNYSTTEKFALALITVSRKLRPNFRAHKIEVLTDQPMKNILHTPKASGRLVKWEIELGEFDIKYKPRTTIKAQALADFVVECTINDQEVGGQEIVTPEDGEKEKDKETTLMEYWVLHFDGESKTKSGGAGLVLQSPDGFLNEYVLKLDFPTTNNEEEYKALIASLGLARAVLKTLTIHVINLIPPVGVTSCWIEPIKTHLETGWLPEDAQEARKLSVRALRYSLVEGLLYKRSFVISYLKCLRPLEAYEALKEAHEGIYGQHLGAGPSLTR